MGAPPPLLTLRDLLELACESSCSEGFRTYPRRLPSWHCDDAGCVQAKDAAVEDEAAAAPVRLLIEAGRLRRSPSRTLSSFLFLPRSPRPASATAISRLTRSLSRRLVFWRRHCADDDDGDTSDDGERDSLGLPSPVVSSCSASECSESDVAHAAADLPVPEGQASGGDSDEPEKPSTSTSSGCTGSVDDGDGLHKVPDGDPVASTSMEEKQQLSPVAVMDFPFHHHEDDDDGDERSDAGSCSPSSFQECQPDLERSSSAHELLHKIRRLDGSPAQGVDPVDLEPRFDASDESTESDDTRTQSNSSSTSTDHDSAATTTTLSDEQHPSSDDDGAAAEREPDDDHHRRLLAQLLKDDDDDCKAATSVDTEWLLLDFFAEALDRRRCSLKAGPVVGAAKPSSDEHEESAWVHAARRWVQGAGSQWGVEDVLFAGAAALADMDRERRWMCVGVEEREVGVTVGELMMDALVAELVSDMALWCC